MAAPLKIGVSGPFTAEIQEQLENTFGISIPVPFVGYKNSIVEIFRCGTSKSPDVVITSMFGDYTEDDIVPMFYHPNTRVLPAVIYSHTHRLLDWNGEECADIDDAPGNHMIGPFANWIGDHLQWEIAIDKVLDVGAIREMVDESIALTENTIFDPVSPITRHNVVEDVETFKPESDEEWDMYVLQMCLAKYRPDERFSAFHQIMKDIDDVRFYDVV